MQDVRFHAIKLRTIDGEPLWAQNGLVGLENTDHGAAVNRLPALNQRW